MLTPDQLQEHYATIERLYSEQQWDAVLQASAALQQQLAATPSHPLLPRLELVIGHTLVYGFADGAAAEARYRQVLNDSEEAVLREIASQGLERCQQLRRRADEAPSATRTETPTQEALTREDALVLQLDALMAGAADSGLAGSSPASGPEGAGGGLAGAMPWELGPGGQGPGEPSAGAGAPGQEAGAAMPWLVELGGVDPAALSGPGGGAAFPAGITTTESLPSTEPPVAGAGMDRPEPSSRPEPTPRPEPTGGLAAVNRLAEAPPTSETAGETGSGPAPEPMPELIPVTVQVIDEPESMPPGVRQGRSPGAERGAPGAEEPAPEEPSPEEMAALAPGLLEVVLR